MPQSLPRSSGAPGRALFASTLLPILIAVAGLALFGPFVAHPAAHTGLLLIAGGAWLGAVALARRGAGDSRLVVLGAVALRCVAWSGDARLSDDAYRHIWEGRLILSGASPYAWAPQDPELAEMRERYPGLYVRVNHKDVAAAYPPLTLAASTLAARLAPWFGSDPQRSLEQGGERALRFLFGLCDLLVLWPLMRLLERARLPAALAVAWGWCPLVALEFAGEAHFDSLGIVLLLASLALLGSARERLRLPGLVALSAAALVKWIPLAALPWLLRGRSVRSVVGGVLTVIALCALGFVPFLFLRGAEHGFLAGISEYGLRWESGSLVYRWIEAPLDAWLARDGGWSDPRRVGRVIAALLWTAFALAAWKRERDPIRGTAAWVGAFLVLSPTLHPWYLAWIVPFLAVRASPAWSWLVAASPLLYWPLAGWQREGKWVEPSWLWPLVAGPFLALLARECLVNRSRRAT